MSDFEFQVPDRNGELHTYTGAFHDFESEAAKLAVQLSSLFAKPMALLAPAVMEAGPDEVVAGARVPELLDGVTQILGGLDLGYWLPELFRHTQRDGRPLSDKAVRKEAFGGNLSEAFRAMVKVIEVNDFLPWLPILVDRLKKATDTAESTSPSERLLKALQTEG